MLSMKYNGNAAALKVPPHLGKILSLLYCKEKRPSGKNFDNKNTQKHSKATYVYQINQTMQ